MREQWIKEGSHVLAYLTGGGFTLYTTWRGRIKTFDDYSEALEKSQKIRDRGGPWWDVYKFSNLQLKRVSPFH